MRSPKQIEAFLERGRARAVVLMTDHMRITRQGGKASTDAAGKVTYPEPVVVYEGPGKVQNDASYPSMPDTGPVTGQATARVTTRVAQVHLPYGTTGPQTGDVAEVIASHNARLVGAKLRLRADEDKTWTTAVRLNIVEVLRSGSG